MTSKKISPKKITQRTKNIIVYVVVSLIISTIVYFAKPRWVLKDDPNKCEKESYCKKGLVSDKCKIYTVCQKIDEINISSVLFSGFGFAALAWFIYYLFTGNPGFLSGLFVGDLLFGW